MFFFFNDTATTEIYTLSLHAALPIWAVRALGFRGFRVRHHDAVARLEVPPDRLGEALARREELVAGIKAAGYRYVRSEEHTSELQSRQYLVCRLLLEKKKTTTHLHLV